MYLAGKDAAVYFARGQRFAEAFNEDKEYFIKVFKVFLFNHDKTLNRKIESVEDMKECNSEVPANFLVESYYNFSLIQSLFYYLGGNVYNDIAWNEEYFEEDLITGKPISEFQETEYVQIGVLPTNEDLDKIAKWLCGGIVKSLDPVFIANDILKMFALEECENFAYSYELNAPTPSCYYTTLHNMEVKLKELFFKEGIVFKNDDDFARLKNNMRYSVWNMPSKEQRLDEISNKPNSIFSCLRVAKGNKIINYKKLLGILKGYKGNKLAAAIYVLVNEGYLSRKPSTAVLQVEVCDTTSKQYFDKCYKDVSPAFSKDEINHWKEVFEKLFNGD